MALEIDADSTDRIEFGTRIGNEYPSCPQITWMALYRPASGNGSGGILTTGGYVGTTKWRNAGIHSTGVINSTHTRGNGSTNQLIVRGTTALSTSGIWYWIAVRQDANAGDADQQALIGEIDESLEDDTNPTPTTVGSGTLDTFASILTTAGNYGAGHTWGELAGCLAWVAQWHTYLSIAQMHEQQKDLSRIVCAQRCHLFVHFGLLGPGEVNQARMELDWSGHRYDGQGAGTAWVAHPDVIVARRPEIIISPEWLAPAAPPVTRRNLALLGVGR